MHCSPNKFWFLGSGTRESEPAQRDVPFSPTLVDIRALGATFVAENLPTNCGVSQKPQSVFDKDGFLDLPDLLGDHLLQRGQETPKCYRFLLTVWNTMHTQLTRPPKKLSEVQSVILARRCLDTESLNMRLHRDQRPSTEFVPEPSGLTNTWPERLQGLHEYPDVSSSSHL